jgi:CubicO group peptidase (beta-lactamase class C family)
MMRLFVAYATLLFLATRSPVLGAASDTIIRHGPFRVEFSGSYDKRFAALDGDVERWMRSNAIPAAQLAVRKSGKLIVSHAYTYGAARPTVTTTNVMRLASVSKMMATAAVTTLYAQGKLSGSTLVFPYLGIAHPLVPGAHPDKNINTVTVAELVAHTGGFDGEGSGDPLFTMRDIEVQIGHEPLTKREFARYIYGLPLLFKPGSQTLYSNVGYVLLGMVVEKATGMSFFDYMNSQILSPLGLANFSLGATRYAERNPAEVIPSDPYTGQSVFDISQNAMMEPFDYAGGDIIWENADSASDFETNAESISRFIGTYDVYGLGGRQYDYARDGCVPGVATWAESLTADIDFALFFNGGPCLGFSSTVIENVRGALGGM